jgi:spore coat protein CotH
MGFNCPVEFLAVVFAESFLMSIRVLFVAVWLVSFSFVAHAQDSDANEQVERESKSVEIFPTDRVLRVEITVDEEDWNTIRVQRRDMKKEFAPERRFGPIEGPYTYVPAKFVIDGVEFPKVNIRKKGLLGSQDPNRPSLKIKLDAYDKDAEIGGLSLLTLNNNRQDTTLMSQFMGYAFFNKVGSPAPRCSYAQVVVNGKNLGVYSHVESAKKPLVERGFGNSNGVLFEGTGVDFDPGWEKGLDRKFGNKKKGHAKLKELIASLERPDGIPILKAASAGQALVPADGNLGLDWINLDFDDSTWVEGSGGAGYEANAGYANAIGSSFNFRQQMHNGSTSVYLRFPFQVDDLKQLDAGELSLLMKYDDGFVAYLNGKKVASANVHDEVDWDSTARTAQGDETGMSFQAFDLSEHKGKFQVGKNVLAIHGLNASSSSSDALFAPKIEVNDSKIGENIGDVVELDSFYKFWATESLLGFWDGYTGNRNNYFVYLNPETDLAHFMPWGGDCMFEKNGYFDRQGLLPVSVKLKGRINRTLYQSKSGRERYRKTLISLLENEWDEEALLAEVDRIEEMVRPFISDSQKRTFHPERTRRFIRQRRTDVLDEIKDGMPDWPRENRRAAKRNR